jgi:hypothetical protein
MKKDYWTEVDSGLKQIRTKDKKAGAKCITISLICTMLMICTYIESSHISLRTTSRSMEWEWRNLRMLLLVITSYKLSMGEFRYYNDCSVLASIIIVEYNIF